MPERSRDAPQTLMSRTYHVYILASLSRCLYVGMTSNLTVRLAQHRNRCDPESFTARYRVTRLVYFETTTNVHAAIARERQLKSWRREKRVRLIEASNAGWEDLGASLFSRGAP